ncbi:SOS-response repressor and protease LexA [Thioalkalivibrio nitratireducens DSM 14787]|uniref:LexA repressor n=1 Tax=Thioalkalivibrio nitratireducens (strain DSM 14787 / UNIQEM 213 / ALEN2) TaxID=1255043 RepID=L0DVA6_THIND|nr:transcriptional repressor LexA [Thioalkalivibrio nitratireducens]AGA33539.1 SOS-response repressor and protease LexA [Thioalkalivibrio nitratireducens DSM 14787]
MKLTARQQEILAFIRGQVEERGSAPTREEICRAFGFRSPYAAECHLRALTRKGAIELVSGSARGIRLPRGSGPADELPLVGRVAAGAPILAVEHLEGRYRVDPRLFHPRPDYLLRVRGESMRDAGILDGDLLAVRQSPEVRNGQIVVARIDDEVTVKYFQRTGDRVSLLPANPDFTPIAIDPGHRELVIEGIGVGVLRALKE